MRDYDVVIVGGGVVGCAIARRLSFTTARVALVEAADDVGEGASKGNTGIATCGADCPPGSLEAERVTRSSPGWEALCATLDTPFRRIGGLAVARTAEEERGLERLLENARANGRDAEIVTGERARAIEPMLAPSTRAALHVPADGIVDPLRLTIGYAELAARNAVDVLLGTPVTGFRATGERVTHIETLQGVLAAAFVVNAAGIEADTISRLAGGEPFSTWPRQGQYWLLDREIGARFRAIVGGVPTAESRGIYCVPTTHGSLLLGPTARDGEDRATGPSMRRRSTRSSMRLGGSSRSSTGGGRSRRSPPTGQRPSPDIASASTATARTWCTPRASARPACRRRPRSPSSSTTSSAGPERRCRTSGRGRPPPSSPCPASSATATRPPSSPATLHMARSFARASR